MPAQMQHAQRNIALVGAIQIHPDEYEDVLNLVKEITGIHLAADKQAMIQRRLTGRLKARGLSNFAEYCEIIRSGDRVEIEQFTNAVTTNLTAFFREAHHFEMLAEEVLPKLVTSARRRGDSIRIWCAGCSTGEEAYSVAMILGEIELSTAGVDIKVLATDLDSDVLANCKAGVYTSDRVERLPQERLHRWFSQGKGANEGFVRVKSQLKERISFKQLNLMHSWPMSGAFDIIICRNVIIYFDKDTQKTIAERFAGVMKRDSYLFLGHSESLMNVTDRFTLLGRSVYELAQS